jgi:hypothetical protein
VHAHDVESADQLIVVFVLVGRKTKTNTAVRKENFFRRSKIFAVREFFFFFPCSKVFRGQFESFLKIKESFLRTVRGLSGEKEKAFRGLFGSFEDSSLLERFPKTAPTPCGYRKFAMLTRFFGDFGHETLVSSKTENF